MYPLLLALSLTNHPAAFVFCRDREHVIRRFGSPEPDWLSATSSPSFSGKAKPGEFFVYQVGIYALRDVASIELSFSDLRGPNGIIRKASARCISLGGINPEGVAFMKPL